MFSASQKKADKFLEHKERMWKESNEKIARLKALRLAKEASDREAAEAVADDEAAGKNKNP